MSELQIVVFKLNGQLFGAEASQVFQIIRYQEAVKVPRMPKFIDGIIEYRGTVIPVISLNRRFELGENEVNKKTKILITTLGDRLAGFVVNDVSEILKLPEEDIEPAPMLMNAESAAYLKKIGKKDGSLISIIDMEKVLDENELKRLKVKAKAEA